MSHKLNLKLILNFAFLSMLLSSLTFSAQVRAENKYWKPSQGIDCSSSAAPTAFSVQGVHIRPQGSGYVASVSFNDQNAQPLFLKGAVTFFQQVAENKFEVKMSGSSFQLNLTVETDKGHTEYYEKVFSSQLSGSVKTAKGRLKSIHEFLYCKA